MEKKIANELRKKLNEHIDEWFDVPFSDWQMDFMKCVSNFINQVSDNLINEIIRLDILIEEYVDDGDTNSPFYNAYVWLRDALEDING